MSELPASLAASGWRIEHTVQQDRRVHIFKLARGDGDQTEYGFLKTLISTTPAARRMFAWEREALGAARFPHPLSVPELLEAGETFLLARFSGGARRESTHTPVASELDLIARGLEALRRAELPPRFSEPRPHPRRVLARLALRGCLELAPAFLTRKEAIKLWKRARQLLPHVVQNPVPSHGDFALTNIIFEDESLVLTDLEQLCTARNGFYDLLHLVLHRPVPIAKWSWQRDLVRRVYRERREELGSESAARLEFEAALFFLLVLRTLGALTWDEVPPKSPVQGAVGWLVGRGQSVPPGGRLEARLPDMRQMLDAENAGRLIQEILGSGPR